MKVRALTYTVKNIKSAFEATGISPLNEHCVLDPTGSKTVSEAISTVTKRFPVMPTHGRAILMHGRHIMNALPKAMTPNSLYTRGMVQKLFNAAARATAENVVLSIENANLRKKATSVADRLKTRSRKELSKARWISSEDVTRIRGEQEERDHLVEEKKLRAIEKKAAKVAQDGEKVQGPSKKTRHTKKKVVINPLPEVIAAEVEWSDASDAEWEGPGGVIAPASGATPPQLLNQVGE